jgi:hypothetical protein
MRALAATCPFRPEKVMHSNSYSRFIAAAMLTMLLPIVSAAQGVSVSVNIAPPELPVYEQPPIPGDGYLWTPGYWAWDGGNQDYYWVAGAWVEAPQPEYLWTPGYWGAVNGLFVWNAGYWGPHVGFYGGVNYGFGYGGHGYEGGYWQGGHLYYNRAVVNVGNVHITNVYNKTVVNNVTVNRVSYNGGNGGVRAEPTSTEAAAAHERHIAVTSTQTQHEQAARSNPAMRASTNRGNPPAGSAMTRAAVEHPTNERPPAANEKAPATNERPPAANEKAPAINERPPSSTVARANPQPARPIPQQPHVNTPRPAAEAPIRPTPQAETSAREPQPHQSAPVEPRAQPAQTQAPRPAPKPQQARPTQPPAAHPPEHAPEHQEEHEHH